MAQTETTHLRLFFALPVPADCAMQIEQWRAELGLEGTLTLRDNLHLTLAFLGAQPPAKLPLLEQLAARLHGQVFELQLQHLACWHAGTLACCTWLPRNHPMNCSTYSDNWPEPWMTPVLPTTRALTGHT